MIVSYMEPERVLVLGSAIKNGKEHSCYKKKSLERPLGFKLEVIITSNDLSVRTVGVDFLVLNL